MDIWADDLLDEAVVLLRGVPAIVVRLDATNGVIDEVLIEVAEPTDAELGEILA